MPQFRSSLKALARWLVPAVYELEDVKSLDDPNPERIAALVERNRARVKDLIQTYIYAVSTYLALLF